MIIAKQRTETIYASEMDVFQRITIRGLQASLFRVEFAALIAGRKDIAMGYRRDKLDKDLRIKHETREKNRPRKSRERKRRAVRLERRAASAAAKA